MPTIKPKKAVSSEILQSFGGIGLASAKKAHSCSDMQNFRVLADGSLEKRCGFKKKYAIDGTIRGFWNGYIGKTQLTCMVADSKLYIEEENTFVRNITLSSQSDPVQFVYYHDHLYLLDSDQIYVYLPQLKRFQIAIGYAPLIGFNWNPTELGALHEPINLYSRKMRISYKNTTGSTTFTLPFQTVSIDSMRADGQKITDFSFTPGTSSFTVNSVYSWVDIAFTVVYEDAEASDIRKTTRALCERVEDREYLFLFGGQSEENHLFGTMPVDQGMLNSCHASYPLADPLYCPSDMHLDFGNTPITSLYKQRNRFLAFYDNGAVSLQVNGQGRLSSYPLLFGVGCTAELPSVTVEDSPIIVNRSGIFMISSDAADPDRFTITPISDSISEFKTESFVKNASVYYDSAHEELWFYERTDSSVIWVYHVRQKQWYKFSGFSPTFFLTYQGNTGFACSDSLFLFDETQNTDNGAPITASVTSGYLFASSPEQQKRVATVSLLAQCGSNDLELVLNTENGKRSISFSTPVKQDFPILYERRIGQGRFRLLQIELKDTGEYRSRIFRLAVFANS